VDNKAKEYYNQTKKMQKNSLSEMSVAQDKLEVVEIMGLR
jgi:hypothetical protein